MEMVAAASMRAGGLASTPAGPRHRRSCSRARGGRSHARRRRSGARPRRSNLRPLRARRPLDPCAKPPEGSAESPDPSAQCRDPSAEFPDPPPRSLQTPARSVATPREDLESAPCDASTPRRACCVGLLAPKLVRRRRGLPPRPGGGRRRWCARPTLPGRRAWPRCIYAPPPPIGRRPRSSTSACRNTAPTPDHAGASRRPRPGTACRSPASSRCQQASAASRPARTMHCSSSGSSRACTFRSTSPLRPRCESPGGSAHRPPHRADRPLPNGSIRAAPCPCLARGVPSCSACRSEARAAELVATWLARVSLRPDRA